MPCCRHAPDPPHQAKAGVHDQFGTAARFGCVPSQLRFANAAFLAARVPTGEPVPPSRPAECSHPLSSAHMWLSCVL